MSTSTAAILVSQPSAISAATRAALEVCCCVAIRVPCLPYYTIFERSLILACLHILLESNHPLYAHYPGVDCIVYCVLLAGGKLRGGHCLHPQRTLDRGHNQGPEPSDLDHLAANVFGNVHHQNHHLVRLDQIIPGGSRTRHCPVVPAVRVHDTNRLSALSVVRRTS